MRSIALCLTMMALPLWGCGGTAANQPTSSPGGSPETPVKSPEADQSVPSSGGGAQLVAPPCEQEIAKECGQGMTDGCLSGVTKAHVCVKEGATKAAPCEQEIAAVCDAGLVDACSLNPAAADNHVCVQQ